MKHMQNPFISWTQKLNKQAIFTARSTEALLASHIQNLSFSRLFSEFSIHCVFRLWLELTSLVFALPISAFHNYYSKFLERTVELSLLAVISEGS